MANLTNKTFVVDVIKEELTGGESSQLVDCPAVTSQSYLIGFVWLVVTIKADKW